MHVKRFLVASIAVFLFTFLFEWLFHGYLLDDLYQQAAALWRSEEELQANAPWLYIGQVIFSLAFCYLFAQFRNEGIYTGIRYGFLVAFLFSTNYIVAYVIQPIPSALTIAWIIGTIIEFALAGIVASVIFEKN